MNEWSRVFLNPKRLGLILLTTVLCLGIFVLSLLDDIAPGEIARMMSANEYTTSLVEKCRGKSFEEIKEFLSGEERRLSNIDRWYYGYGSELPFESEDEAIASISDLPALVTLIRAHDDMELSYTIMTYMDAVTELKGEADYLSGYNSYLANIQAQAELQSQTSLFGTGFSRRNLAKTAKDFAKILDVQVEFGNSSGIKRWLDFELGDYFHLIAMVIIVMSFLEERRRGLWSCIRTTKGGRAMLGLTRIGILFAGSLLATVLYTFLPFVASMTLHGGWADLGRSLQSIANFGTCPLKITVFEWLLQFYALKVLSGALIGLLLWCVLGCITNAQFSISVLGVTLAAEFVLYEYLPVQSILNGLKYFNIFSYVHTSTLYTEYLNVDLFTFPAGVRAIALWGLLGFGILFSLWAVFTQAKRRPEGNKDILSKIAAPINRALDYFRTRFSIATWEGYKSLIFQYGILLLVLVYLIGGSLDFLYFYGDSSTDIWYDAYISDMEGPIDEKTDAYLEHARESAEKSSDSSKLLFALSKVERRVEQLRERAGDRYQPWIVDDYDYEICYGSKSINKQRLNAAIAILLTTLLAASLWSFEKQSGVVPMLRTTPRGRGQIFRRKAVYAVLLAAFVWACIYMREINYFLNVYPQPTTLAAPVGNLDSLSMFPLNITLIQYLILLYAVRLFMLIGVAETALAVGHFCPNVRTSYMVSAALLGLPALMTALGAEMFKWVSPIVPVASAELMWNMGGGDLIYLLPWLAWCAIIISALYLTHRRWTKG